MKQIEIPQDRMVVPRTHAFIGVHNKGRITQKGWAGYGWRHVYAYIHSRALIRASASVARSAPEGPRKAAGGPPEAVCFQHMYEKYARKSLSNLKVFIRFLIAASRTSKQSVRMPWNIEISLHVIASKNSGLTPRSREDAWMRS